MNTYVKTWLTWIALTALLIFAVFFTGGWLRLGLFLLVMTIAFTWPRCPRCKLPVYWTKAPSAVDHFAMYRPRLAPGRTCARCNQELDGPT